MISSIALRNFRSILRSELAFSPSGLDVLVGANGSGKTNFVRALEFISQLHSDRLSSAVARQGGQRSLLPKSVPFQKLRGTATRIEYRLDLGTPEDYRAELSNPSASHLLGFRLLPRNLVRVDQERIDFAQPLQVAESFVSGLSEGERPPWATDRDSSIAFLREPSGQVRIRMRPAVNESNLGGYVEWFGLPHLHAPGAGIETREDFFNLLDAIQRRSTGAGEGVHRSRSILEYGRIFFALAAQVRVFRETAGNIRRFDLQLDSLRGEQQASTASRLSGRGDNLPAVVRWIKGGETEGVRWELILGTLRDIAPYVYDVDSNLLSSGREYVEFFETKSGRPVESWDASDGALRALAMLIALETHPPGHTLILEEPEKGLHPWAVRSLFDHIRDVIDRRGVQVIVTTHSPQVLEAVRSEEVVVATRTHRVGTRLRRVDDILQDAEVKPSELGRLWVKGLLGGFPHDTETHG